MNINSSNFYFSFKLLPKTFNIGLIFRYLYKTKNHIHDIIFGDIISINVYILPMLFMHNFTASKISFYLGTYLLFSMHSSIVTIFSIYKRRGFEGVTAFPRKIRFSISAIIFIKHHTYFSNTFNFSIVIDLSL